MAERVKIAERTEVPEGSGKVVVSGGRVLALFNVGGSYFAVDNTCPHRGGPLRYTDDRGAAEIVSALEDLAQRFGPRFEPCAEMRRRARGTEKFYQSVSLTQPALT